MRAGVLFGNSRSLARAGAVLLVLLAALVHTLDCAHGPTAPFAMRADTLLLMSPAHCGQTAQPGQETTARPTAPEPDSGVRCSGLDEPTAQPPRDVSSAVPSFHTTPVAEAFGTSPALTPPAPQESPAASCVPSTGQTRARLGVWRT
ncbi:hypothetical protein ACGF8B_31205 [Streptomyces sp. NPDC047917]|uniref:hypothetical protein n=1 Tax=Streptomyces sp. NPDC047917 TaxID=3365491 RepID=UPI0037247B91